MALTHQQYFFPLAEKERLISGAQDCFSFHYLCGLGRSFMSGWVSSVLICCDMHTDAALKRFSALPLDGSFVSCLQTVQLWSAWSRMFVAIIILEVSWQESKNIWCVTTVGTARCWSTLFFPENRRAANIFWESWHWHTWAKKMY